MRTKEWRLALVRRNTCSNNNIQLVISVLWQRVVLNRLLLIHSRNDMTKRCEEGANDDDDDDDDDGI